MGSVEPKVATYVEFAELLGLRGSDLGILHMKTMENHQKCGFKHQFFILLASTMGFFTIFFSTLPRHVDQKPRYPKSGYKTMDIMTKKTIKHGDEKSTNMEV